MNENKELYILNKDIAEKFIVMVKNHHGLHLDFSSDSVPIFEKAIDTLRYITGEKSETIKASMSAYLGHLLLTLFKGEWFQNEMGIGICLRNTGLGENIEIFPSSWIEKRLRKGRGDSIEFKIAVLADSTLMEAKYNPKWPEDICLAEEYAKDLAVSIFEKNYWDKILQAIISNSGEDLIVDLDNFSKESLKYLRGRLIKLQDIHPYNFGINGKIDAINKCFPKSKLIFADHEFLALLKYLQDSPTHPNGGLLKNIWAVEKNSSYFAKSKVQSCNQALIYILKLISKKVYHHDIIDFKKVLNLIGSENNEIIEFLSNYKPEYEQGCYKAIKYVMGYKFSECLYIRFNVQKQVIEWLDNASGRTPKKPWKDKLSVIQQNCLPQDLSSVCEWMISHDELRYDEKYYWLDSVFSRFQKSSRWYLNK